MGRLPSLFARLWRWRPDITAAGAMVAALLAAGLSVAWVLATELNTLRASDAAAEQIKLLFLEFLVVVIVLCAAVVWQFAKSTREKSALSRQLQRHVASQQVSFDTASDAIVLFDRGGTIATLNRAGEEMFGQARDMLLSKDASQLFRLPAEGETMAARLAVSDEQLEIGVLLELLALRRDGERFPVDVTFRSVASPVGNGIAGFVRDISERKRLERLKDEFVSTVNHELRTPLTSIAGSLGLLAGGAAGELPAGAVRLIAIAHANCQRLIRLINDMLDVEKIQSGKMRFEVTALELPDVVRRSVDAVRGYADQLGVHIDVLVESGDIPVRGDSDRLDQVLTNLISNALKFSSTGGRVHVSAMRAGRLARFCVRDEGPGIPDEFRSRIFTKFAQADSSDARQKNGTGLGLVIAKEIVDRHGGRLWFESLVGRGTSFFVDLPLVDDVHEFVATRSGVALLVCEDDPDAASVLREVLERDGFAVDVVSSIAGAATALDRKTYRALLLDLVLPDGDGVALIRRLRAREKTRDLPIVVVSAQAQRGKAEIGTNVLNVVDWMDKPIDIQRLRRVVRSLLARTPAPMPFILHVEDDHDILQVTASALAGLGEVVPAESLASARAILARCKPDLVILDLGLADGSGLDLLPDLGKDGDPLVPVIIFSAQDMDARLLLRVEAVMTKSKTSLGQLAQTVKQLLDGPQRASVNLENVAL